LGIKSVIKKNELPLKYQQYKLKETVDGISDSVYILSNKYVLKVLENNSQKSVKNEKKLLNNLYKYKFKVPKILDIFQVNHKQAIIYSYMQGKSLKKAKHKHIKQIAKFLKKFHKNTKNISYSNKKTFRRSKLKQMIKISKSKKLKKLYETLNIKLNNDGVIHGDLFLDNAKFKKNRLSGVYDFSEACIGDFHFDLAVVAISWCLDENNKLDKNKIVTLLKTYDQNIKFEHFKEYIKYALVYYATTRYINNRNYKEILKRIKGLK